MSTSQSRKRPRSANNTLGRKGVSFGTELDVREFSNNPIVIPRGNYTLPAAGPVAKEKPGNNWNAILARGITERLNGQKQSQPFVPRLPPNNARRRQFTTVYSENSNAEMAEPLGPPVIGASPASLWPTLSRPKGGRRSTRKRIRKRS